MGTSETAATAGGRAGVEERVDKLEQSLAELKKKRRDGWDKFQAISPFLTAVVVAVLGFMLNQTVSRALQEQQLLVSNVKEMRDLLLQLGSEDVTKEKAETTALALAAFGRYAIPPLISVLDVGGEVRGPAAETGLRAVGLTDRDAACERMAVVSGDRNGVYTWTTHRFAIRVLGELGCVQAAGDIQALGSLVRRAGQGQDAGDFRRAFREGERLDDRKLREVAKDLEQELARATSRLQESAARGRWIWRTAYER